MSDSETYDSAEGADGIDSARSPFLQNTEAPGTPSRTSTIRAEMDALLPRSKGQLGLVAQCLQQGITDRRAIVDAGAGANTGAVANTLAFIHAIQDGTIPQSAPTVARMAAGAARSFRKQHREVLSNDALVYLDDLVERLNDAAGNRAAQEQEESELQNRGEDLETALATQGGAYVFTYPHYWRYPTVEGTNRTLLNIGMTTQDAHVRVRQQARSTAIPEDPLLLRVYQHTTKAPRELERDFHDLLNAAGHSRADTNTGGTEGFETSLDFLDMVAAKLGMTVQSVEGE